MKIALLTEKYTPDIGGLAISSERFARLFSSAEHEVRVFAPTLNLLPSEKRTLSSNGVSVTRFGAHKRMDDTLVDWFELIVQENKREPFDVLHAYFLTQAGFVATNAGKYLNIPSVASIRGNDIERAPFDPSKFSHMMYALQNASAVTTNTAELAKKARTFIEREIHLIPNGVDTDLFKPLGRNELLAKTLGFANNVIPGKTKDIEQPIKDSPPSPKVQSDITSAIGFVGELREKKGIKALLSAYAQVNKTRSTTLLVVGTIRQGEDKQFFEDFVTTRPNLQIIVTGYVSPRELPTYYALMDVFVHPSLRDGMPNAVLEAMACEKAVVATGVGGVSDVIKNGENGSIVPVNNAEALSSAILDLLENDPLRKRLGKSARRKVVNSFSLEKELNANLDVYRSFGLNP